MRRSKRFQTGGSQKSKDAIKEHKKLVDKIVMKLECEDKLNRRFIRKLISDPNFLNKIISVKSAAEAEEWNTIKSVYLCEWLLLLRI